MTHGTRPKSQVADAIAGDVTRLLAEIRSGNQAAFNELLPLIYAELRALAHQRRRAWKGDNTLGTTALVHEAYLKLVGSAGGGAETRLHFLRVASTAMRQVLCNYARDQRASKRGGDSVKLSLDELADGLQPLTFSDKQSEMLLDLDAALHRLHAVDPRLSGVVECRFFGGLSIEDTAQALGTSSATVKRDWAVARAWLYRELRPESPA